MVMYFAFSSATAGTAGVSEVACGWVTDKFGLSWQVIPKILDTLFKDPEKAKRVMNAVIKMKKLIIADMVNA